jgi:4-hydroxy-4-methyl-2-oxoglutarate aldolase
VFVAAAHLDKVLASARAIGQTGRRQAAAVREGHTLRDQLQFKTFLDRRAKDAAYTFRKHLRALGGAIEE